jgi:hypothetical protein
MELLPNPNLNLREQSALDEYRASGKPPLSPRTSAELLALYLNGYTCEELAKLHPTLGLGIIVQARCEHKWDIEKDAYVEALMSSARQTVTKAQLEAIRFAADGVSVYHKLVGNKFRSFLRNGQEEELSGFEMSFANYQKFIALLMQLTGQDEKKPGKISGEIQHTVSIEKPGQVVDVQSVSGPGLFDLLEKQGGIK